MIGKVLKAFAYSKAPRATLAVLHPRTAAKLAHTRYDLKHSWAPRVTAVGAALIALPLGYLAGRMARRPRRVSTWQEPSTVSDELGTGL